MSKFNPSESSFPISRFLEDPLFQEWVFRPNSSLESYWKEWISENPGSKQSVKEARSILLGIESSSYQLEDAAIQDLWKKVQKGSQPKSLAVVKDTESTKFSFKWIAACMVILACLACYFFLIKDSGQTVHRTGFGETLSLVLPDSSHVILNANSTLTYATNWDSKSIREVWVEGEAFFDVKHLISHQPFKVYPASGIELEVLGTQFNVYQRNNQTKVLLSEGNVTMSFLESPQSSKILMKPGDLVEYDQQKIQKKQVNPSSYVSWTTKILQLESTQLEEMIRMAEENYGIKIKVNPTVDLSQSASGSMPLSDGDSFMKLTSKIFNIQITYQDSIYYIE